MAHPAPVQCPPQPPSLPLTPEPLLGRLHKCEHHRHPQVLLNDLVQVGGTGRHVSVAQASYRPKPQAGWLVGVVGGVCEQQLAQLFILFCSGSKGEPGNQGTSGRVDAEGSMWFDVYGTRSTDCRLWCVQTAARPNSQRLSDGHAAAVGTSGQVGAGGATWLCSTF